MSRLKQAAKLNNSIKSDIPSSVVENVAPTAYQEPTIEAPQVVNSYSEQMMPNIPAYSAQNEIEMYKNGEIDLSKVNTNLPKPILESLLKKPIIPNPEVVIGNTGKELEQKFGDDFFARSKRIMDTFSSRDKKSVVDMPTSRNNVSEQYRETARIPDTIQPMPQTSDSLIALLIDEVRELKSLVRAQSSDDVKVVTLSEGNGFRLLTNNNQVYEISIKHIGERAKKK